MRCRACASGALVLAALAGCAGGGGSSPGRARTATATTATATQTSPQPEATRIVIERPADGSRLRASADRGDVLRARTRVRGSASPSAEVFLSAACRPRRCDARATAGADGRWSLAMTLRTTADAPFVAIDARAAAGRAAPVLAVATVELTGSPAAATSASATRRPATRAAPIPAPRSLPHEVLVIGDSLAVGMEASLRAALPGWRVRSDARIGRPLAEGMGILREQRRLPSIIALSLFTNDDPRATAALEEAVRTTAGRPGGCAVWSTIVRPPYNGVSYDAANAVLERLAASPRLAPALRLVDWRAAVAGSPSFIAGDGVHGTPAGYQARGELYAAAIEACASGRQ